MNAIRGFGTIEGGRILAEDDLFIVASDKYPVSPGHSLVIVKRVVARFQDLTTNEKARLMTWVDWCIAHLQRTLQPRPDGFNVGLNDGPAAGQTIPQLHFHVIPRYQGDVSDPRGGVRWVVPNKARYWTDGQNKLLVPSSSHRGQSEPDMKEEMKGTVVERLAFFLLEKTGSVCGKWTGRMRSAEQKALLGRNLCGKREIQIDGARETIKARKTVCFGTDFDIQSWTWREIVV